jgi:hypothetical protein
MFLRRGEALGSVRVDVDPSEAEKQTKRSAAAKKAVAARSEQRIEPGSVESVPAAIHSPGEFRSVLDRPDPKPKAAAPEPDEDEGDEVEVPAHSAVKAEWVDFAVSQGLDPEEAEGYTKQELIDEYGG